MIDFTRLETRIAQDEGFRANVYQDTLGYWTIGYGSRYDGDGNEVHAETPSMPRTVAQRLLRADIYEACKRTQNLFDRFGEMNAVRQEVLVNMAYNLGNRLEKFAKLRSAAYLLRYEDMADEMTDSLWFRQVGQRGVRLAREMRTGQLA